METETTKPGTDPRPPKAGIEASINFQPPRLGPKTTSYSLLSSSEVSRKSRSVAAGVIDTTVGTGNISMPSSSTPPATTRKTSGRPISTTSGGVAENSLRAIGVDGEDDDVDLKTPINSPSAAPSTKGSKLAPDEGNRLSFSSLFSMGSTMQNSEPPESTPSSVAGSLRSGSAIDPQNPNPLSAYPTVKGESPTTATDNVSVTSTFHSVQSGVCIFCRYRQGNSSATDAR